MPWEVTWAKVLALQYFSDGDTEVLTGGFRQLLSTELESDPKSHTVPLMPHCFLLVGSAQPAVNLSVFAFSHSCECLLNPLDAKSYVVLGRFPTQNILFL